MGSKIRVQETHLSGLHVLERTPVADRRGFLDRIFCDDELAEVFGERRIVQINHTFTAAAGTVRGMHFQHPPFAEAKIVSCLKGEVFDVAVDLRRDSATFLQWHAEVLSAENHKSFLIPEGFAHGYQTLSADCELLYLHTARYRPEAEGGCRPTDPGLAISWPMEIRELSERDESYRLIADGFLGVVV